MEITIDQLYEFKSCSLRYKFMHLDKLPVQKSANDSLRESLLTTIAYFYFNLQEGKLVTLEDIKQKFTSLFYDKDKIFDIMYDDKGGRRKKELDAFSMLATFYRQQYYNPDKVVGVNVAFRVKIDEQFFVRGNIPLLRETVRGVEMVNFKTSNTKPDEFWQRTDMSLTLQAIGYHSMYKREADSICLHQLKQSLPIYVNRKKKDYHRLYKSAKMMKKAMDEGWYYPRESYSCDACPAKPYCMEWS